MTKVRSDPTYLISLARGEQYEDHDDHDHDHDIRPPTFSSYHTSATLSVSIFFCTIILSTPPAHTHRFGHIYNWRGRLCSTQTKSNPIHDVTTTLFKNSFWSGSKGTQRNGSDEIEWTSFVGFFLDFAL